MGLLFDIARKHAESLYEGRCDIIEYSIHEGIINNVNPLKTAESIPCRLSYQSIPNAAQTEKGAALTQVIKLFLSPDIEVKPGSSITVTQHGETNRFICAGKPAVYGTHQEVELTLESRWA